ncbi:MAG: hypothetical protein AAF531_21970 [Actinomycetota bacterium]
MLANRVRTITDGQVELDPAAMDGPVAGAVVDGRAFYHAIDERSLGPALRWAGAQRADRLTVIGDPAAAGHLARRASLLTTPIDVWEAEGVAVTPATPEPARTPPALPEQHLAYRAVIAEAGARPIDDHGMLIAEVAGLEVARVVDTDEDPTRPDGAARARLDVGVGQADRELQQYIHGHLDDDTNLRRAIAAVVRNRNPAAAAHPLSRLARQRWLRSVLLDDPSPIGTGGLTPVVPLRPRDTLLGTEPAAAAGDGVIVICSVGVDLDLLPEAADYRDRENPDAELVVVVPERDRPMIVGSALQAVPALRVTSIELPWEPPAPDPHG